MQTVEAVRPASALFVIESEVLQDMSEDNGACLVEARLSQLQSKLTYKWT